MTFWVAGAAVVSAGIGYMSSESASKRMAKAGKDPLRPQRMGYAQNLADLRADPGSILKDPAFMSSLDLGAETVNRHMAAQGYLGSGMQAMSLYNYGQTSALGYLNDQEKFLAELAGFGNFGSPAATAAGARQGYEGTMSALGQLGSAAAMFGGGGSTGSTAGWNDQMGTINNPASYQVGGGTANPFTPGSWDQINARG